VAATDHLLTLLDLSRWQFATTVMFHMTFPAITVGLAIFLCVLYGMHWRGWRRL
jgi:cytochrome d ubiquinol oxidase subunit I